MDGVLSSESIMLAIEACGSTTHIARAHAVEELKKVCSTTTGWLVSRAAAHDLRHVTPCGCLPCQDNVLPPVL